MNKFIGVRDDGKYLTWWEDDRLISVRKDSDFARSAPPQKAETVGPSDSVKMELYPRPLGTMFTTISKDLLNAEKQTRLTWRVVGIVPVNDQKKIMREVLCCVKEEAV